jgi:hypothetical protein
MNQTGVRSTGRRRVARRKRPSGSPAASVGTAGAACGVRHRAHHGAPVRVGAHVGVAEQAARRIHPLGGLGCRGEGDERVVEQLVDEAGRHGPYDRLLARR